MTVPTDYFDTESRMETVDAGRALVGAFTALGITEFDDISILDPCPHADCTCSREAMLSLGNYRPADIRDVVQKLRRLAPR